MPDTYIRTPGPINTYEFIQLTDEDTPTSFQLKMNEKLKGYSVQCFEDQAQPGNVLVVYPRNDSSAGDAVSVARTDYLSASHNWWTKFTNDEFHKQFTAWNPA